jgi:hypothetical protein
MRYFYFGTVFFFINPSIKPYCFYVRKYKIELKVTSIYIRKYKMNSDHASADRRKYETGSDDTFKYPKPNNRRFHSHI